MKSTVEIQEVDFGSPHHAQQLKLRGDVLRIPLGLDPATARHPKEAEGRHFVALDSASGAVVGCVSLLALSPTEGKLFQMAVSPSLQRRGVGLLLVRALEDAARASGLRRIVMHAREAAALFYEKLGYTREGDLFYEVTVPHYAMAREL